jgi:hypothetical protein
VEKVIKEMRDKKATRDDDIPLEAFKFLWDSGLSLLTQLIIIYTKVESGPRISLKLQWVH